MLYPLKNYQKEAVDELVRYFDSALNFDSFTTILKAPTGSGKTLMMTYFVQEICENYKEFDCCFIWCSIGKGELHKQSFNKVSNYLDGNPECSLIEQEFFGPRSFIKKHEIVFLNWEKFVDKDKEGNWKNSLMKDQEGSNFIDVLKNTRLQNRQIILIVDECHIGSSGNSRIKEFKSEILQPRMTFEMSATPILNSSNIVLVNASDVIDEGIMKRAAILNKGITKNQIEDKDSEELILEKAYDLRLLLLNEYKKIGSNVNPLVLIQVPNVEEGEKKKLLVSDFLRERGITRENGRLAFWLDNDCSFDKNRISDNDNKIEFLFFKYAISTGWDCPRAHILVKFREGKSETFEIQVLGRILRTAEAKSYNNELLDNAYVFTNLLSITTKGDEYFPNMLKNKQSFFRKDKNNLTVYSLLHLKSFYRTRAGNFNDADSEFLSFLESKFEDLTGLKEEDKLLPPNLILLETKGLKINAELYDEIKTEANFKIETIDEKQNVYSDTTKTKISESELENKFYSIIKEHLNGLVYKRSKSAISYALGALFTDFINVFPRSEKVIGVQKVVVTNEDFFGHLLDMACQSFKLYKDNTASNKPERFNFEIDSSKSFAEANVVEVNSKLSLYQPLYLPKQLNGKVDQEEVDFINYLDTKEDLIEWFWKNGDEAARDHFAIGYDEDRRSFLPDFIVKYKDGTIGLYDTKDSSLRSLSDTKPKAEALQKYIFEVNSNRAISDGKLCGGIVVFVNGIFYLSEKSDYEVYSKKPLDFKAFNLHLEEIKTNLNVKPYIEKLK